MKSIINIHMIKNLCWQTLLEVVCRKRDFLFNPYRITAHCLFKRLTTFNQVSITYIKEVKPKILRPRERVKTNCTHINCKL